VTGSYHLLLTNVLIIGLNVLNIPTQEIFKVVLCSYFRKKNLTYFPFTRVS